MDIDSIVREELQALIEGLLAVSVICVEGADSVVPYFRTF